MVEVVRIKDPPGMEERRKNIDKTEKKNDYAGEDIRRKKYNRRRKEDIHCPQSHSFINVSDEQWEKIFGKKSK